MDQKINLEEETILGLVLTDGMLLELLEKREFKTQESYSCNLFVEIWKISNLPNSPEQVVLPCNSKIPASDTQVPKLSKTPKAKKPCNCNAMNGAVDHWFCPTHGSQSWYE